MNLPGDPDLIKMQPPHHRSLRHSMYGLQRPAMYDYPKRGYDLSYRLVNSDHGFKSRALNHYRSKIGEQSPSSQLSCLTEMVPFVPSCHGETRRRQRDIGVGNLQAAIKHGRRIHSWRSHKNGVRCSKYVHNDIISVTTTRQRKK